MIRIFTIPVAVSTPHGRCLARFGIPPSETGDPWWVLYRDASGAWFTAMVDAAPQA